MSIPQRVKRSVRERSTRTYSGRAGVLYPALLGCSDLYNLEIVMMNKHEKEYLAELMMMIIAVIVILSAVHWITEKLTN